MDIPPVCFPCPIQSIFPFLLDHSNKHTKMFQYSHFKKKQNNSLEFHLPPHLSLHFTAEFFKEFSIIAVFDFPHFLPVLTVLGFGFCSYHLTKKKKKETSYKGIRDHHVVKSSGFIWIEVSGIIDPINNSLVQTTLSLGFWNTIVSEFSSYLTRLSCLLSLWSFVISPTSVYWTALVTLLPSSLLY